MFWRLDLATRWRLTSVVKNACLAKIGAVFKSFFSFPSNFSDCSSSFSIVSFPNSPSTHFQTSLVLQFSSKSSSNRYGFSFLNSFLLDFVFFPLDYSHLFMFLRWVFGSAITLCPCLAYGSYWFSLSFIKLLVLFFIMWLARIVISWFLIFSDPLLKCWFKMFLCWLCVLLCWLCGFNLTHFAV